MKNNILLFVADEMRADTLHHLGNEAAITPNLDDLAQEGVSFENAFCQNPVCVPSRNSFLTGLYPHTRGHRTMGYLAREEEPSILKEMKNNGYEVVWVGRNDYIPGNCAKTAYCDIYYDGIHNENLRDATDYLFNPMKNANEETKESFKKMLTSDAPYSFYMGKLPSSKGYGSSDWRCIEKVLEYLDKRTEQDNEKPFFIYCTLQFPHPPYGCEDPWYSAINREKLPPRRLDISQTSGKPSILHEINRKQGINNWQESRFNELRATYLAMVSRFDAQFGLIANKLKEKEIYENTNIIVFSDHGDYAGDYGIAEKVQNCFDSSITNVPLIIKPAQGLEVKPRVTKAQAELLDLPATIAEMAEFTLSYTQFGHSLIHVLKGDERHKEAVFCEGGRLHGETQAMEYVSGPESPYWPRHSTQQSEGPEHTKAVMCKTEKYKYVLRLYEQDELYDLENDPMELENLSEIEEYQDLVQDFKNRILTFYMETTDYVPQGKDKR